MAMIMIIMVFVIMMVVVIIHVIIPHLMVNLVSLHQLVMSALLLNFTIPKDVNFIYMLYARQPMRAVNHGLPLQELI